MKYKELIQFEPIDEVVKIHLLDKEDNCKRLVKSFVYSDAYISNGKKGPEGKIPVICNNLDFTNISEHFGVQVVGSYGTGKSHLMSLISIVAENDDYLQYVSNDLVRDSMKKIAGKYNVIRFELGSSENLWKLVGYQIDQYFKKIGIDYSILADDAPDMYIDKLQRMMAAYEQKEKSKGLLIVIDEMLAYLRGRSGSADLNQDLQVLQALGQMCDASKFRIIFGVQELIYSDKAFQFASAMLTKVSDRYLDITITKQDVQYVVQNRLLKKDEHQKQAIRDHLKPFLQFFTDMSAQFETYVSLFPVSPSYFENFQQIRIGKSQREILKTLSNRFASMMEDDVPDKTPGLICYDEYWEDLKNISSLQANPDVRTVKEIMENVDQKIDNNFTGGRAAKKPLAHRIANACAIKILQAELNVCNGINAEMLIDDLCYIDPVAIDREMLKATIESTANNIVKFTMGQFFDKSENGEYHLRIEGGVNYEQMVKDFADQMPVEQKDQYYYQYLSEILPIEIEPYRNGFRIYSYELPWVSHKVTRQGYIFMGCKNERSTTHPEQSFYLYFLPIFVDGDSTIGNENDSVYVRLNNLSPEVREKISLWAASKALEGSVDSSQKDNYKQLSKRYFKESRDTFNHEFWTIGELIHQGNVQSLSIVAGGEGKSKLDELCRLASIALENNFAEQNPDYPEFKLLAQPMNSQTRETMVKGALQKIVNYNTSNRNGEAILAGLGLINDNRLCTSTSMYARSVKKMLEDKGGQVVNLNELLYQFWNGDWRSIDFNMESDLEFVVLSAMVALGEIDIVLPQGKSINAGNLQEILTLPSSAYYSFSHVRFPKGANMAAIKEIFISLVGADLSAQMDQDPGVFAKLLTAVKDFAGRAAKMEHEIHDGYNFFGNEIISASDGNRYSRDLHALKEFCDKVCGYNTAAKMKNQPYTLEQVQSVLKYLPELTRLEQMLSVIARLRDKTNYLNQAKQYVVDASLLSSIEKAISNVGRIGDFDNESECKRCEQELQQQCERYADWYLQEYLRCHINENMELDKQKLLHSVTYQVCQTVSASESVNSSRYNEWNHDIQMLRLADSKVNKERILESPYQGFNPHDFEGKSIMKVSELKTELQEIFDDYDNILHQMVEDPSFKKNRDALDKAEQTILDQFEKNQIKLDIQYAAQLVQIIDKLHKGITKVTITASDMPKIFSHPMTTEEAVGALREFIEQQLHGQDRKNVRIIFK